MPGLATEGFFEFGEALPWVVFGGVIRGDAPEVEKLDSLVFGVKEGGSEEGDSGREFFVILVGGGLHIVARAFVVEKEASGDDFVFVMDKVEGGEGLR